MSKVTLQQRVSVSCHGDSDDDVDDDVHDDDDDDVMTGQREELSDQTMYE